MGWKNVKEHYGIEHIVCVTDAGMCIGSPYIHDIIVIGLDGKILKRNDGRSNDELKRYMAEFDADPEKLRELVTTPDNFKRSLTVYTYDDGQIVEKKCEKRGWPNVTHDGCIQYDNMFSKDKATVVAWAKRDVRIGIKWTTEAIAESEAKLTEQRQRLAEYTARRDALDAEYPEIKAEPMAGDEA